MSTNVLPPLTPTSQHAYAVCREVTRQTLIEIGSGMAQAEKDIAFEKDERRDAEAEMHRLSKIRHESIEKTLEELASAIVQLRIWKPYL